MRLFSRKISFMLEQKFSKKIVRKKLCIWVYNVDQADRFNANQSTKTMKNVYRNIRIDSLIFYFSKCLEGEEMIQMDYPLQDC